MGSCPGLKLRRSDSLPVLNMVVIGLPKSGKSSIINCIATDKDEADIQDNSLGKVQLDIGSFILQKRLKIVAFQLPSSGSKTWKYYYINAHILTFVIDSQKLIKQPIIYIEQIKLILKQIDEMTPETCKILIIYSKIDKIKKDQLQNISYQFMPIISQFKHQICTIKCSTINGEGIDKLCQGILSFHNHVNI